MIPIIGALIGLATEIAPRLFPDRDAQQKFIADFQSQLLAYDTKRLEAAASIIVAEAKGESWMQRNWRPCLMMTATSILGWNYLAQPLMVQIFGLDYLPLTLPDGLWDLLTVGVGGYVVGRTVEKAGPQIAANMRKPWRNPDTGEVVQ